MTSRSINIPAANYVFFGAGIIVDPESWLVPFSATGPSIPPGGEIAASLHVQRDGIIRRMTISQSTPTVQQVTYTLEAYDPATSSWYDTGVTGEVAVGAQIAEARGSTFVAQSFDFIRIKVSKAPAEPDINHVRVFVELA